MSEQREASKPAALKPCKNECGFFGSNATGDCCSRCWASIKPKDGATRKKGSDDEPEKAKAVVAESTVKSHHDSAEVAVFPAFGTVKKTSLAITDVTATADPRSPAKKKKKKASYKNMMSGMLEGNSKSLDIEKEKEKLKEMTGGGHFQKIDKI